jgi:predicted 3-demethylubiquinone-9 3-methyltransferase (glyoxalase superfamily)
MAKSATTFLMFEGKAEEAMTLYASLFKDAKVAKVEHWKAGQQGKEGSVKRGELSIAGHQLILFDSPAKHAFTFTPSISLFIDCESEAEQREAYDKLSDGGQLLMPLDNYGFSKRFAWVSDRYGVSWQLNLP